MDPNRTGLLSMNLRSFKQALSLGTKMPHRKCKCGIKAREGVVLSKLGYGYFCGNAYGGPSELWVS
jgi:hypothetical protein